MTFDSLILAAVADELNRKLVNGRVDKIQQPSPLDIVLTIRNSGENYRLLVSADAQFPRIHLTSAKRPNPKTPPNFCMLLRKYLERGRLTNIEQVDFDRILRLKFAAFDGERTTLVVEIMGKHSNVILTSDSGRILGAVKLIGPKKSRYRQILPGRQYVSPPAQDKINPLDIAREEFNEMLADTFPESKGTADAELTPWLTKTFTGISPFAAKEAVARSKDNASGIVGAFVDFLEAVRTREFDPVLITDDRGQTVGFYPFPSSQHPPANQHGRSSTNLVADIYYTSTVPREEFEHSKAMLVSRLRHELKARERTISSIEAGIADTADAERCKQLGELILAQPHAVQEGASEAALIDYYDPAEPTITVELDPRLNAAENADAYFRKYQKAVSGASALQDRLAEAGTEVKLLEKLLKGAQQVASDEQIRGLIEVAESRGIRVQPSRPPASGKQKRPFDGHRIRSIQSSGWEILVGQNSEANDYLLTRVANPTDLWVHVKAVPSAHVIIRTNGKPDAVPKSVLYAAAELAALHSDARHSSLVPVDYTLRKYVRKPRGAPAGKVLYQNEKTIFVTPT